MVLLHTLPFLLKNILNVNGENAEMMQPRQKWKFLLHRVKLAC